MPIRLDRGPSSSPLIALPYSSPPSVFDTVMSVDLTTPNAADLNTCFTNSTINIDMDTSKSSGSEESDSTTDESDRDSTECVSMTVDDERISDSISNDSAVLSLSNAAQYSLSSSTANAAHCTLSSPQNITSQSATISVGVEHITCATVDSNTHVGAVTKSSVSMITRSSSAFVVRPFAKLRSAVNSLLPRSTSFKKSRQLQPYVNHSTVSSSTIAPSPLYRHHRCSAKRKKRLGECSPLPRVSSGGAALSSTDHAISSYSSTSSFLSHKSHTKIKVTKQKCFSTGDCSKCFAFLQHFSRDDILDVLTTSAYLGYLEELQDTSLIPSRSLFGRRTPHVVSFKRGMERPDRLIECLKKHEVDKEQQLKHAWNSSDASPNIYIKEQDKLTFHRHPIAQSTDGVRGRFGFTSGLHVWLIRWNPLQRGTHAMVGVGTKQASLHGVGYQCLIGSTCESWGWDLVSQKLVHFQHPHPIHSLSQQAQELEACPTYPANEDHEFYQHFNKGSVPLGTASRNNRDNMLHQHSRDAGVPTMAEDLLTGLQNQSHDDGQPLNLVATTQQHLQGLTFNNHLQNNNRETFNNNSFTRRDRRFTCATAHDIYVILDMDVGTLSYMVNSKFLGIAFRGLKGKIVYPMVSAVWGHCEVTMKYINGIDGPPSLENQLRHRVRDHLVHSARKRQLQQSPTCHNLSQYTAEFSDDEQLQNARHRRTTVVSSNNNNNNSGLGHGAVLSDEHKGPCLADFHEQHYLEFACRQLPVPQLMQDFLLYRDYK